MCRTGKVHHKTFEQAVIAMKKIGNAGLKTYCCPYCKDWHLANDRRPDKIQARIDQLLKEER